MPPPSRRYRVSREVLAKGAEIEAREHPSFGPRTTRRIARDHIQNYGPGYYAAEPVTEKIIAAKTKEMGARPMKRKRREPDGPFFDPSMRNIRF
jgi:hypothetical protein